MKTYPIMLNMRGREAVVVGGGDVAMRKAKTLVEAGASVRLIAERLNAPAPAGVEVRGESYRPELLQGALLVFACTDDRKTNARIAADARKAGALVNAADQPDDCDFYLPAVTGDGDVVIAVGTGGSAPALAARLKEHLRSHLPQGAGEFAELLGRLRKQLQKKVRHADRRGEIMKRMAEQNVFELFGREGAGAVVELFEEMTRAL